MNDADPEDTGRPLFAPIGLAMIRAPLLAINVLEVWTRADEGQNEAANAIGEPTSRAPLVDQNSVREFLSSKLGDPVVREAILVGSPELYRAIPHWQQAPDTKKGRQAERNLFRYLVRMSTRPTPFGLFAGVTMGTIGSEMDIRLSGLQYNRKRTRVDMQWLLHIVQMLEQRPEVAGNLRFSTNPLSFVSGGRLYIPYLDSHGQGSSGLSASLRATPAVMILLDLARQFLPLQELRRQFRGKRPDATDAQFDGLVKTLHENMALISELRPPLLDKDPLSYLIEKLSTLPNCQDISEQLLEVRRLAAEYDAQTIGRGLSALQMLRKAMDVPATSTGSHLQVDMAVATQSYAISSEVGAEICRAAELMMRLSPRSPEPSHLTAYRQEFIRRYGEGREISVLELLDEDIGLGPPPTYRVPSRTSDMPVQPPHEMPVRDRKLLELAAIACTERQREVELDEDTLNSLEAHASWKDSAPDTLELYTFVAAASMEAINRGAFRVVIAPLIGVQPAGRSFGRFFDVLDPDATRMLRCLAADEEGRHPAQLHAELTYLPARAHAANVTIRPCTRRYEVPVGTTPLVPPEEVLFIDDLVVGVRGRHFYVRSVSRNADVRITTTHLLNYHTAPNVCRFLAEVSTEGNPWLSSFDWGPAARLPFLPRVRVGRIILAPAEWHLPASLVVRGKTRMPSTDWYRAVQQWRQKWNAPRYVYMVEADNRLLLDLECQASVDDLADECWKGATGDVILTLQEMIPSMDEIWCAKQDQRYILEFVIPLRKQEPAQLPGWQGRARPAIPLLDRLRPPGSDWLYIKLYCGRTRQDDLIAGPVAGLAESATAGDLADRWFYVRYMDPEPHLRLRFHGNPDRLLHELLPQLEEQGQKLIESGMVRSFALDTYDREIERYGGPDGMALAEQLFALDSITSAALLRIQLRNPSPLDPVDLALLTIERLLLHLGLTAPERRSLYHAIWQGIEQEPERTAAAQMNQLRDDFVKYRRTAQTIVGNPAWLRGRPGGRDLEVPLEGHATQLRGIGKRLQDLENGMRLWAPRGGFLASCVHMHMNRLFGINRDLEIRAAYSLERLYEGFERFMPPGIQVT